MASALGPESETFDTIEFTHVARDEGEPVLERRDGDERVWQADTRRPAQAAGAFGHRAIHRPLWSSNRMPTGLYRVEGASADGAVPAVGLRRPGG